MKPAALINIVQNPADQHGYHGYHFSVSDSNYELLKVTNEGIFDSQFDTHLWVSADNTAFTSIKCYFGSAMDTVVPLTVGKYPAIK